MVCVSLLCKGYCSYVVYWFVFLGGVIVCVSLRCNGLCSSVFIRNSQIGNTSYKKQLDTGEGSRGSNHRSTHCVPTWRIEGVLSMGVGRL